MSRITGLTLVLLALSACGMTPEQSRAMRETGRDLYVYSSPSNGGYPPPLIMSTPRPYYGPQTMSTQPTNCRRFGRSVTCW
jgi:hypothetical protein